MENAMTIYEAAPPAEVQASRGNYKLHICGRELMLRRDQDFGKIPGTKTPSLYKAGAEKIVWNYGITTKYVLEQAIEQIETGFFFYRFRCELWKGDMLITMGYGSSNSKEKKTGNASGFDVANTCLKIAKKRALVDGAILIGQLSGMFTQDIENEVYNDAASAMYGDKDPTKPISQQKITHLYAACTRHGMSKREAKEFLAQHGYKSAKEVLSGAFDALIEEISAWTPGQEVTK